jgi:glycosyltransferase involved in cell wall biosynthesis
LGAKFGRNTKQIDLCLSKADFVTVETLSEVSILQSIDFSGSIHSGLLSSGGVELVDEVTAQGSRRKGILVKGVQDLPGRALNALAVLPRIRSLLIEQNHTVYVYSASPEVVIMCELLKKDLGIDIEVISQSGNLLEKSIFLKYFEECRVYLGCSISNGASTSMLEAMSRGAFPIESRNSLAEEVIKQAENGFIIDPWEQEVLAANLVEALSNDRMVDSAQERNFRIIRERYSVVQQRMLWTDFYRNVLVN